MKKGRDIGALILGLLLLAVAVYWAFVRRDPDYRIALCVGIALAGLVFLSIPSVGRALIVVSLLLLAAVATAALLEADERDSIEILIAVSALMGAGALIWSLVRPTVDRRGYLLDQGDREDRLARLARFRRLVVLDHLRQLRFAQDYLDELTGDEDPEIRDAATRITAELDEIAKGGDPADDLAVLPPWRPPIPRV